jgi:hypothetical protein
VNILITHPVNRIHYVVPPHLDALFQHLPSYGLSLLCGRLVWVKMIPNYEGCASHRLWGQVVPHNQIHIHFLLKQLTENVASPF